MNEVERSYQYKPFNPPHRSLPSLLVSLGIARERVYIRKKGIHGVLYRSFWERFSDPYELEELLADAKKLYHQKCKELRTDQTANHEEAVRVIRTWQRIKTICKWHNVAI